MENDLLTKEKEFGEDKIEVATERLLADHLFDPTNKLQWIDKLVEEGLDQENAKRSYKIAAHKFHDSRNKLKNQKSNLASNLGKAVGYTGAGIFTFVVMPWVYVILVFLAIAILGFVFGF